MIPWLSNNDPFPDISKAYTEESGISGLLAAGADLSPERMLLAYTNGIFPWFSQGQPILWWTPEPRMVLPTDKLVISRSLKKTIKKIQKSIQTDKRWQISFDRDFESVIRACTEPRPNQSGTWITEEIIAAYTRLHRLGFAHSAELWLDKHLAGGLYGICIGKMFYGESMFSRVRDASKAALAFLVHFLKNNGVALIDCQQETLHLKSLGAITLSRTEFAKHLQKTTMQPAINVWKPDMTII